jgi:hypothetical protein
VSSVSQVLKHNLSLFDGNADPRNCVVPILSTTACCTRDKYSPVTIWNALQDELFSFRDVKYKPDERTTAANLGRQQYGKQIHLKIRINHK